MLLHGAPSAAFGSSLQRRVVAPVDCKPRLGLCVPSLTGMWCAWGQIQPDLAGLSYRLPFLIGGHLLSSPAINLQHGAARDGDVHGYAVAAMAVTCYPTCRAVVAEC
jgi:hypothetical protein